MKKQQINSGQQYTPIYTPVANCLFYALRSCKIKIHPLIIIFFSLYIPYTYLNWVDQSGFNQKTGQIFILFFCYKLLKELFKCSFQHNQCSQKYKALAYLQKLLEPVFFQFSLLFELEIQFYSIFFSTVAPFVIKNIQKGDFQNQNYVFSGIKRLKGKYLILTQAYLIIFTINPILKHVYVMDFKLPCFVIMIAIILTAFIVVFYITLQIANKFDFQNFWKDSKQQFTIYKIGFLVFTIFPSAFHMFSSYKLDTMLATRFIYQIWICLHFGYFLVKLEKSQQTQIEIRLQQRKTINFSFKYGFAVYFIEMIFFYLLPIQNMVVRILITYINIALVFIPSLGLLLRQIYQDLSIMIKK